MATIHRRTFTKHASAAIVAAASSVTLAKPTNKTMGTDQLPIVDTHQHLWDLSKFDLPWVKTEKAFNRSFVTKDYLEASRGLNVVKAVYMEVDVSPKQQVAEAEYVIALSKDKNAPTAAAVISGRPASDRFRDYITRFKDNPYIKGVRQVLHVPSAKPGLCLTEDFVRGVRLLGELGMSFDLCMRPTELNDGVKLADLCKETRFIVDHCGNADLKAFDATRKKGANDAWHKPEEWRRSIGELAKRKNVICKISGIVVRAPKDHWTPEHLAPIINHCLDEFGPDRVVFGSDWPVCTLVTTYRKWVEALKAVISNRDKQSQRKLLHDNAVKFYKLA